jgi:hypothetical protein
MLPVETSQNAQSWYKGDYGFYGNNEKNAIISPRVTIAHREPYTTLNQYKTDHIKRFDELNSGLADSYSLTKGGALLSMRNKQNESSDMETSEFSAPKLVSQSAVSRSHDLRSVWIPKKFEGRNMFASHIDSTIFPDKARWVATHFLIIFGSNFEKYRLNIRINIICS